MDVLKRERLILIEKVRTAEKYCLESLNANTRASEIKKRITILESYFQCFLAVEKGLMKDVNFLSFSSEFDPVYFKVSGILQDALDERSPQTSFASTSSFVSNGNTDDLNNTITKLLQQQQIMLESSNSSKIYTIDVSKLNIEVFDGESYDKWVTFQDLFESLIHNNKALSDAQRLSALTRLLKEEPKRMISHLKISDGRMG